jgi:hypothetical protein
VPAARNYGSVIVSPQRRQLLRLGGPTAGCGGGNSPEVVLAEVRGPKDNVAPVLSPGGTMGAPIPERYPLCFPHRLEPVGKGQEVQIAGAEVATPAEVAEREWHMDSAIKQRNFSEGSQEESIDLSAGFVSKQSSHESPEPAR